MPTATLTQPARPQVHVASRYDAPTAELEARLHFAQVMADTDAVLAVQL